MTADAHLSSAEAQDLLAYLPPREQVVLGHVLDCPACHQLVVRLLVPPTKSAARPELPHHDYGEVWAGLVAAREEALERLVAERRVAEATLAELLKLDGKERKRRVRTEVRYRSISLAFLLLERSHATTTEAPEEGEELALLAVLMLDRLDPEQEPRQLVAELRVRAWGLVAHACWVMEKWGAVRDALERAERQLVEAGYSTKGLGFRRAMAAFRRTERSAAEAFVHLTRAVRAFVGRLAPEGETLWRGLG